MSRTHDGVSCDSCLASNFAGDRFKCLRCFDFDLCRDCFENGRCSSGGDHSIDHPVQCIMTREDFDFAHAGEPASALELRALSFTCPHCGRVGFNQTDLYEHAVAEHARDIGHEVICPICVVTPSADPNRLTMDLGSHIATDHIARQERSPDESSRGGRRLPPGGGGAAGFGGGGSFGGGSLFSGRGAGGRQTAIRGRQRSWQTQQLTPSGVAAGRGAGGGFPLAASPATTANQDSIDSISELLSQLGGIRRANSNYSATLAQIQNLQQQLSRRSAPRRVQDSDFRLEEEVLRSAVHDQGMVDLWSELAATHPSHAVAVLESVQGRMGENAANTGGSRGGSLKLVSSVAKPSNAVPSSASATAANSHPTNDREYGPLLAPKLFDERPTEEETAATQVFLRNRSEFVSQIFVDLCLSEKDEE